MMKVYRKYHAIQPGEWTECIEIVHEGHVIGFVDRERTPNAESIRTRSISGMVIDGECIEWLMKQPE